MNTLEQLRQWVGESGAHYCVALPDSTSICRSMGLTDRSMLGAVLTRYGYIRCAGGHLRLLGGSNRHCQSVYEINNVENGLPGLLPGLLAVADDSAGGIFGINCGLLPQTPLGTMLYLSADSLYWEALEIRYADFVNWALHADPATLTNGGWPIHSGGISVLHQADLRLKGKLAICRTTYDKGGCT